MEQKKPRKSGKPWITRCRIEQAKQDQITVERIFADMDKQTQEEKEKASGLHFEPEKWKEFEAWFDQNFL